MWFFHFLSKRCTTSNYSSLLWLSQRSLRSNPSLSARLWATKTSSRTSSALKVVLVTIMWDATTTVPASAGPAPITMLSALWLLIVRLLVILLITVGLGQSCIRDSCCGFNICADVCPEDISSPSPTPTRHFSTPTPTPTPPPSGSFNLLCVLRSAATLFFPTFAS